MKNLTIKNQLIHLAAMQYCYVSCSNAGSYVIKEDDHIIFSRTVNLVTHEIIETKISERLSEFEDVKNAIDAHYNPAFIVKDCIGQAIFELDRVSKNPSDCDYMKSHQSDEFGTCVYWADLDFLNLADGTEIDIY